MFSQFQYIFLKEKRKKEKNKRESFCLGGFGRVVKVFGENTTRRVEIFIKTRRA